MYREIGAYGESPGANCTNGGASLTAANGVTYICNGLNGTNGATDVAVRTQTYAVAEGNTFVVAMCNAGVRATGGGATGQAAFDGSGPVNSSQALAQDGDAPEGWGVSLTNPAVSAANETVYVVCAAP